MADYDTIVIGAGNGGLTAAATLAKAGLKVLLLERHNIPGGCATSFLRGRFEFEVALHQLSGMGTEEMPGPLRLCLQDLDVLKKIAFVEMEHLYRIVFLDRLDITLTTKRAEIIKKLQDRFPSEKNAIAKFFDLVYAFANQLIGIVYMKDPEASKEKYPLYFKYALKSSQEVLDEFFKDPLLKAVIGAYWGYMGLPPSLLSFDNLAILLFAYSEFKPFHIKGGSQALSNALVDSFLENNGEVKFNCGVKKILIKDGKVTGVITEQGDEISTDYIVSNADLLTTYIELIDRKHVPEAQLKALGGRTIGTSAFTIFTGLDCEPSDVGIEETTNFICSSIDAEKAFSLTKTLEAPQMMLLTCYDVSDPDFSPPGTCQTATVALGYADPWLNIPPSQYADTKYQYAQAMLDLIERVFPEYRGHIEEIELASPITHLRFLGHPGGAIYGFDQYAKDSRLFASSEAPISGLFFAGAWVAGGGFQPTLLSGGSAARAVLKEIGNR